ncbi:MAG: beta-N-acetylglucosaminidase domain-containing protein [Caulobacteraceae bacterium]|nr:beta-N-acetylglucosaminidase domain-containing protein [Caulobacteraceae bacterium]
MPALAPHGYRFFLYAPKADPFPRRRWREPHPDDDLRSLRAFGVHCRRLGVRFGVGLSPFEVYRGFDGAAKAALAAKLKIFDDIGVEDLAILFDDMRGDLPDLAPAQVAIVDWIAARTRASRVILCPTYYSDDPLLDRHFGARSPGYLGTLGARLDPGIEVFWTGPEVCSREYSPGHLARVSERLRRKATLWDNYPVNDGPVMSRRLHLRAFTGRPAAIGAHLAAHAINPALQPFLTRLPAITLARSYNLADDYDYGTAFEEAAQAILGPKLASMVRRHVPLLQDAGLDGVGAAGERLRERYGAIDHPAAREICAFLDGAWAAVPGDLEAV